MTTPILKPTTFCIMESLPKDEPLTGSSVYYNVLGPLLNKHKSFELRLYEIPSKEAFLGDLRAIADETMAGKIEPAIQIEMHGNEQGLGLVNGDRISWAELAEALLPINVACRNRLFLTLVACKSGHVISILTPVQRAPFSDLIASHRVVDSNEIETGFKTFYRTLIETENRERALAAFMAVPAGQTPAFEHISSATVLVRVVQYFRSQHMTPEGVRRWAERFADRTQNSAEGKAFSREERIRLWERRIRESTPELVKKMCERYFMADLYPEAADWFEKNYAQIEADSV